VPILKWVRNQVYSYRFRGQLSMLVNYLLNLFTPVTNYLLPTLVTLSSSTESLTQIQRIYSDK